jgi:DNA-binding NarL/FixJ family response regulator
VIRVAVADDQVLVRSGFTVLLRSAGDIEVVGEAGDGREAVDLVTAECPDVVLMDIRMPDVDGIEATRRIVAAGLPTRILVLTTFDLDEYVFGALQAGASGFLLKDTEPDDLLAAVRVVAAGEALLAPRVTRRLIERFAEHDTAAEPRRIERPGIDSLTEREVEVLGAVARGLSNAEIAEELFMAHATAKTHVSRLLTKLDCRDRAQLVMVAYEAGIVVPGSSATPD